MTAILLARIAIIPGMLYAQPEGYKFINPVTLGLRDGCVERFMGKYYAMGGGTKGKIRSSANLVEWTNDILAITTDEAIWLNDPQWTEAYVYKEVAAGDIIYYNGVFHAYWNGIGHGYSAFPFGPYTEASVEKPFDDYGIDPQIFQDENGDLYYVKKRNQADPDPVTNAVSDMQGPEVWVFKLKTPFDRWKIEAASMQLRHQPGHPTSLNHHNFEGPELFKYRDRYYMFYASNRMGPRSGMYEIGVAESDEPMNFDNSKKYPHPVLTRNTEQHMLDYNILLPTAEHGGWEGRYSVSSPPSNWMDADFNDAFWTVAQGGFGKQEDDLFGNTARRTNVKIRARKTAWTTENIYIRRLFTLDKLPSKAALKHWVFGDADFYINGHKLSMSTRHNTYAITQIDANWLNVGKNIVAVKVTSPCYPDVSSTCQQFVDFGLYDTGEYEAEDIVIAPAQPNVITGPNGFEQWMMYKAYFNASEQQGIDRIHFYNKEAVVETSTVKNTKGYRPRPAMPTWSNQCEYTFYYPFLFLHESTWKIYGGVLRPTTSWGGDLLLRKKAETNYRFEVSFRIKDDESQVGIYAFYKNDMNWVKLLISKDKKWVIQTCVDGNMTSEYHDLPEKFEFIDAHAEVATYDTPWHTLVVYKNTNNLRVELDRFTFTLEGDWTLPFADEGLVGVSATSDQVEFDALLYTIGWHEYDKHITGWTCTGGEWSVGENGMTQSIAKKQAFAIKGDPCWNYEFSTYMSNEQLPNAGKAGFYPLYVDEQNYVLATINYKQQTFDIEGLENGKSIVSQSIPLRKQILRQYTLEEYPTTTYRYDLRNESLISGVNILWLEGVYTYLNTSFGNDQTFDLPIEVRFEALQNENWVPIEAKLEGELRFSEMNHFSFSPIKTKAIRMLVTNKPGRSVRAFCAYFDEDASAGYFLRCRRESDGLHLFLDNVHIARVDGDWGKAKVGLYTEETTANYNGILHYQSGQIAVESIEIDSVKCAVGESQQITATVSPYNATYPNLYWESSDPAIASVNSDGILTRHMEGYVQITAYATDGNIVRESFEIDSPSSRLQEAETNSFIIYPNPANDKLFYMLPDAEKIIVYSISGKEIMQYKAQDDKSIPTDQLKPGPYILVAMRQGCRHAAHFIINR